jgi:hypothetical protein
LAEFLDAPLEQAAFRAVVEILVSQTVRDITAGSGLTFEDVGERESKAVPGRWRLSKVVD